MERDIITFIEVEKNILANLKNIARLECEVCEHTYTLTVLITLDLIDEVYVYNLAKYFFFYPQNPLRALVESQSKLKIQKFCADFLKRVVTFNQRYISQDQIDEIFLEMLEELGAREFYTEVYSRI